ncbi:hypothetical protein CYMTET_20910 [Cymbomonas tetramitiformis]|uniref:Uncharacterized protein n=1 Tax=Cymbomonas tetramitiformis TaxID=36881 RepID=A0AAE0G3U4_9CHLO|nr:hypothetical protein CYMTET_20910 [Cymbomonas tetramitiformis]
MESNSHRDGKDSSFFRSPSFRSLQLVRQTHAGVKPETLHATPTFGSKTLRSISALLSSTPAVHQAVSITQTSFHAFARLCCTTPAATLTKDAVKHFEWTKWSAENWCMWMSHERQRAHAEIDQSSAGTRASRVPKLLPLQYQNEDENRRNMMFVCLFGIALMLLRVAEDVLLTDPAELNFWIWEMDRQLSTLQYLHANIWPRYHFILSPLRDLRTEVFAQNDLKWQILRSLPEAKEVEEMLNALEMGGGDPEHPGSGTPEAPRKEICLLVPLFQLKLLERAEQMTLLADTAPRGKTAEPTLPLKLYKGNRKVPYCAQDVILEDRGPIGGTVLHMCLHNWKPRHELTELMQASLDTAEASNHPEVRPAALALCLKSAARPKDLHAHHLKALFPV